MPPREAHDITAFRDAPDMIEPRDAKEEMENAEANEPMDPIDRADPIDPIERTEPTDPMERTEPFDRIESTERCDFTESFEVLLAIAGLRHVRSVFADQSREQLVRTRRNFKPPAIDAAGPTRQCVRCCLGRRGPKGVALSRKGLDHPDSIDEIPVEPEQLATEVVQGATVARGVHLEHRHHETRFDGGDLRTSMRRFAETGSIASTIAA